MSLLNEHKKPWSKWHERLHKTLKSQSNLLPFGSSLLLAVSGGQDSMVLLKLILDLKRIYEWKLHIWHGDHGWHENSKQISLELEQWCIDKKIPFYCSRTNKKSISTEQEARDWRYQNLIAQAKFLSKQCPSLPCKYVLTGHTGSDRAETLIMNLARGTKLADKLSHLENDQNELTKLAIEAISQSKKLNRIKIANLSLTARSIILNQWFKENQAPLLSSNKLQEISRKITKSSPPGLIQLSNDRKLKWDRVFIEIIRPSQKIKMD